MTYTPCYLVTPLIITNDKGKGNLEIDIFGFVAKL
jgi:hypothetical protein